MHGFRRLKIFFTLILALPLLQACERPDPNPELKDPIYRDLKDRAKGFEKSAGDIEKSLEDLKDAVDKAEPRSLDLIKAEREYSRAREQLLTLEQKARYYKIRAERRKLEGRAAYKKAFAKGEKWPKPEEHQKYLSYLKLKEAPRDWGARVPSMANRFQGKRLTEE